MAAITRSQYKQLLSDKASQGLEPDPFGLPDVTGAPTSWIPKGSSADTTPIQSATDTYAPEQPTEQRTTLPTTVVEATRDAQPPTNLQGVGTSPPTEITDVVNDFDWTASINKKQLGGKIPYIRLTEFKLTANNALNGLAAAAMAFADLNRSTTAGSAKLGNAASTITQGTFLSPAGGAVKMAGDVGAAAGAAVAPYLKKAEDYIKSKTNDSFGHEGQHLMDLFGNLYARESTGRTYTLPYYNRDFFHTSNSFSDSTEEIPPVVGALYDTIKAAGVIPSLFETGVYVQRPKFYQFASSPEPAVNVSLTLYNTLTPMSYLKHAKFIQQLALNNLPRRITRVVVEPPCIYEVFIPGKAFYPYCFISRLQVTNVGTRRLINNEIIPDAFQIDISLTSLIKDASNLYDRQMQQHGIGAPAEVGAGGSAGSLATGGGNNMGSSGAQRDAVAGVDSGVGASMPASSNDTSIQGSLSRIEANAARMEKSANEDDARAVQFEKAGDHQRAADFRAIAAYSRQSAANSRANAAQIRETASKLP